MVTKIHSTKFVMIYELFNTSQLKCSCLHLADLVHYQLKISVPTDDF